MSAHIISIRNLENSFTMKLRCPWRRIAILNMSFSPRIVPSPVGGASDAALPQTRPVGTANAAALLGSIQLMAQREERGLTQFFRLCGDGLFSFALRALDSRSDAEEILQDALVRVWDKAAEFDPSRSHPYTWAVMITRGLVYDRLRRRSRRVILEHSPFLNEDSWGSSADPNMGQWLDWEDAWATLSEQERSTLTLAVFSAATAEEIAKKRDEPIGTVKTRTHRALHKLRQLLFSQAP